MWALAGAWHCARLGTAAALCLGSGTSARLRDSSVHRRRAGDVHAALRVRLWDPHHRREALVLRNLHCRIAIRHARLRGSLEIPIMRHLVVGLDVAHAACCSINGRLLRHALLLVLVEAVRGQLVHLLSGQIWMRPLDLALEGADGRDDSARQRIGLTHARRRSGHALRCATMERWTLHASLGLHSSHHSRVIWAAIDTRHVDVWRSLRSKLLVVELLLLLRLLRLALLVRKVLLLLLSRLQKSLLLLQSIRFPDDPRIVRRCLHRHTRSCAYALLHLALWKHLHRHIVVDHLAINGRRSARHTLHGLTAILVDAKASLHTRSHAVRCAVRYSSIGRVGWHVVGSSSLGIHHLLLLLLVGHLASPLSSKTGPLLGDHLLPVLLLPFLQLDFPFVFETTELRR